MTRVDDRVTTTGGREATTLHIPPKLALAVGMPATAAPAGWRWSALTSLARLESGHTPSRKHPEYWGGSIPWISIQDARNSHGRRVESTIEHTNDVGIANSSARILPVNTVCLSRTASVGYVVVMGRPKATSQDFVNWVCTDQLDPDFLKYIFIAEGAHLLRFASGSVHQTIYFPAAKAFYICHPSVPKQKRIVAILDKAFEGIATAKSNAEKNLQNAGAIFRSVLHSMFVREKDEALLSELASEITDGDHMPPPKAARGIPFITISNILKRTREIDFTNTFMVSESYFKGLKPNRKPRVGDILYTVTGSFGIPVLIEEQRDFCFQRHIGLVRPRTGVSSKWLMYALLAPQSLAQAASGSTGTAQKTVSLRVLRDLRVPRIPVSEQTRIAGRLDMLCSEIRQLQNTYERKLAALDALKQSMLHRAFAGELTADKTPELIEAVA